MRELPHAQGPSGDLQDKRFAGGFGLEEVFGTWVSSNITPDKETGIGRWTDAQIVRAIREGKHRDGRTLGPPMPFELYRRLSDRDVRAMVVYLRTLVPVKNAVPRSRYTIALPASYGPVVRSVPEPSRKDRVKYGEYLAGPVAHCVGCHTPLTRTVAPTRRVRGPAAFPSWGRGARRTPRTSRPTRRPGSASGRTTSSSGRSSTGSSAAAAC